MGTIRISKIKARRGPNSQRKLIIFDQGELVYTTDTQRLYVGTGAVSGGFVVGSKTWPILLNYSSLSNTIGSEIGDLAYANNKYYQLTALDYTNLNSWVDVSTKIDSSFFNYNASNQITLNANSINARYINSATVSGGITINGGVLQSNFNTKSLEISSNQLSLKSSGIDEREINSTAFNNGITGGSGSKIGIQVDTNSFYFNGNTLSLSSKPIITQSLSGVNFINGVTYNSGLNSVQANIDTNIFQTVNNQITLNTIATSGTLFLPQITVDKYGRVANQLTTMLDVLTGFAVKGNNNSRVSGLSSIFDGSPGGGSGGANVTMFAAVSVINGTAYTVTLSSAGFLTFSDGNNTTRTGQTVKRFAIPIFSY